MQRASVELATHLFNSFASRSGAAGADARVSCRELHLFLTALLEHAEGIGGLPPLVGRPSISGTEITFNESRLTLHHKAPAWPNTQHCSFCFIMCACAVFWLVVAAVQGRLVDRDEPPGVFGSCAGGLPDRRQPAFQRRSACPSPAFGGQQSEGLLEG